ncbi:MAG: response regulator [Candidatus Omnitrophica bacterium]|nr:response regulator [Candidatus Omnitrophota bacterium]
MPLKTKILVVDDDVEFTETLKDLLELEKCDASIIHNGYEALQKVRNEKFDIVLMDIKMPGINGVETLKEIKKIAPRLAVILMTGYSLEALIKDAFKEGALAVLDKPLDIPKLFGHLAAARSAATLS